jgi:hypothetical protein
MVPAAAASSNAWRLRVSALVRVLRYSASTSRSWSPPRALGDEPGEVILDGAVEGVGVNEDLLGRAVVVGRVDFAVSRMP